MRINRKFLMITPLLITYVLLVFIYAFMFKPDKNLERRWAAAYCSYICKVNLIYGINSTGKDITDAKLGSMGYKCVVLPMNSSDAIVLYENCSIARVPW